MKLNRTGITRLVIELETVVIKVPNFSYSWLHFLNGLVANINENQTWKYHTRKDLLCPIIYTSWGGWILIMRKATPITSQIDYSIWITEGLGGDDKPDNYGILDGIVVKLDYGS